VTGGTSRSKHSHRAQTRRKDAPPAESDCHALTASSAGVMGFDAALRSERGREELVRGRPVCRAAGAGFGSGRLEGAGHDRPGSAQLNRRRQDLGAACLGTTAVPDGVGRLHNHLGVTTQGSLTISADAGQTWKTDLATVTRGQAISASRDKAGVLEILVVTDKGVLQSRGWSHLARAEILTAR
jgi:hypothetical protein